MTTREGILARLHFSKSPTSVKKKPGKVVSRDKGQKKLFMLKLSGVYMLKVIRVYFAFAFTLSNWVKNFEPLSPPIRSKPNQS